ncbi:glycosyltransferase family 39 protein [Candidatus Woesebacteria bacterium]|nr:glycosyltransferase family 39 protein [Candidatus Woesebacteria bacterium]
MQKKLLRNSLLLAILFVATVVRLYRVHYPLLDWHSFRQADTASVTREYVRSNLSQPLIPHYHDNSNIQSGKDNLEGYRMVEFPLVNIMVAAVMLGIPGLPLVITSRIFSILFSLGTTTFLFLFARHYFSKKIAHLSALFFAVLPYSIFYSRAILPEPAMLFFACGALYFFSCWLRTDKFYWYGISIVFFALALLLKPFVAFYGFVFAILVWNRWQWRAFTKPLLYLYPLLSLAPFFWWRQWIQQFPSGIPASDWLFNGDKIRLRPAWFRWLGYERLTKLILGYSGLPIFLAGLFPPKWRSHTPPLTFTILIAWWVGLLLYAIVIATGNVRHDYYQVLWLPPLCLTLAQGVIVLDKFLTKKVSAQFSTLMLTFLIIGMVSASWYHTRGYFAVNHWEYVRAGEAVDQKVPANAKMIAPAFGDTSFLFQTNRSGWPIGFEIEKKISLGATHYVTTSMDDEAKELMERYKIIEQTAEYVILDLTSPKAQ